MSQLRRGRNTLEVMVPTVLINETRTLEDQPMVRALSHRREGPEPTGLLGPARLRALRVTERLSSEESAVQ